MDGVHIQPSLHVWKRVDATIDTTHQLTFDNRPQIRRNLTHDHQWKVFGHVITIKIPQFLLNPWNSGRIVSYGFVVISAFSEACIFNPQIPQEFSRRKLGCRPWAENDNPAIPEGEPIPVVGAIDWRTAIAAISTFLLWIQFIQLLILSRPLAAFTYTLSAMFVDVTRNLAIILVILVSFAFTLTTLEQPGYESPGTAVLNLLYVILGMSSAEMESLEGIGLFCLTREFLFPLPNMKFELH
jgi:hypothetical protein